MHDVGWHYERARGRIDDLVRPLPPDRWDVAVPACPGWRVRDVLAHLVGGPEDAAAGRLDGIPTDEQTAAQVERHRAETAIELLDTWRDMCPFVAHAITQDQMWPAAFDAVTHEHDLRGALGVPGARDDESVELFARMLGAAVDPPAPLIFDIGTERIPSGATSPDDPDALTLSTSPFELLRLRLGRRSRRQVEAMAWSADPASVLPHLFVFGPSPLDIVE